MTVLALDHVQLAMPVGEETRARGFYSGILGLPEKLKPPSLVVHGGAWFERGDLKVHLGVEKNFIPARKAHPAFIVDDLDGVAARLRDHGYPVIFDDAVPGSRRLFTEDTFGNRLELIQASSPTTAWLAFSKSISVSVAMKLTPSPSPRRPECPTASPSSRRSAG